MSRVQSVNFQVTFNDNIRTLVSNVTGGLDQVGGAARGLVASLAGLGGALGGFFGAFGAFEFVRKSLDAAEKMTQSSARLMTAIQGNVAQFQQLQSFISQLSAQSTFSNQALTEATTQLIERGGNVAQARAPEAAQAAANLAAALNEPIEDAATQLAGTFQGQLVRTLSRAVPGIRELSKASLEAGGAIDLINKAFGGFAEKLAATPFGQLAQQQNLILNQYQDLGNQLVKIESDVLPTLNSEMKEFNEYLASQSGKEFLGVLSSIINLGVRLAPILIALTAARGAIALLSPAAVTLTGAIAGVTGAYEAAAAADKAYGDSELRTQAIIRDGTATYKQRAAAWNEVFAAQEKSRLANEAIGGAWGTAATTGLIAGGSALGGAAIGYAATGDKTGAITGALASQLLPAPLRLTLALGSLADAVVIVTAKIVGAGDYLSTIGGQGKLLRDTAGNLARSPASTLGNIAAGAADVVGGPLRAALNYFGVETGDSQSTQEASGQIRQQFSKPQSQADIAPEIARRNQIIEQLNDEFNALMADKNKQSLDEQDKDAIEENRKLFDLKALTLTQYLDREKSLTLKAQQDELNELKTAISAADRQALRASPGSDQQIGFLNQKVQLALQYKTVQDQINDAQEKFNELVLKAAPEAAKSAESQLKSRVNVIGALAQYGGGSDVYQSLGASGSDPVSAVNQVSDAYREYQDSIAGVTKALTQLEAQGGDVGERAREMLEEVKANAFEVAASIQGTTEFFTKQLDETLGKPLASTLAKGFETGFKDGRGLLLSFAKEFESEWAQIASQSITHNILSAIQPLIGGDDGKGGIAGLFSSISGSGANVANGITQQGQSSGGLLGGALSFVGKLLGGGGGATTPDANSPAPTTQASSGGGFLSSIIGSLGSIVGGFFAAGGNPPVGVPSVVGERGAELFVPHTAGTIVPDLGTALSAYASSRGIGFGMGRTLGGISIPSAGAGSHGQATQNTTLPVMVADDRSLAALLAGGNQAFLRHISTYSSDINQALGR
jgi:hypothetical protein